MAALGVSRMTVNRALRELAASGEVVRMVGVGTFAGEDRPQSALLRVANIADEIRVRGHEYSCDVVRVDCESAAVDVAAALGLSQDDPVYHSVCVHRENGVPIQLEDRYVNSKVAPKFVSQDFTRHPPSEYLLRAVPLDEVEHVVDAVIPSRDEARLLEIGAAVPGADAENIIGPEPDDLRALCASRPEVPSRRALQGPRIAGIRLSFVTRPRAASRR